VEYRFDDFVLDVPAFALRRAGEPLAIQPKALDVLLYLIRHRDRVVPKKELLEKVWTVRVSEPALNQAVLVLRRAVADDGDQQRIISTVRGRGFRFVATLHDAAPEPSEAAPQRAGAGDDALIGRDACMLQLQHRLDGAIAGRGSTMTIAGEGGVGKTRLLDEVAAVARAHDVQVLRGRAFDGEGAPRFWPWAQVLRGYVDDAPAPLDAATAASLGGVLPELAIGRAAEGSTDDFSTLHAVTRFLKTVSAARPLLILLDDVHLADAASLLLLRFCGNAFARARVLLVATFRDAALAGDPQLARTLGALRRENPKGHIELRGFDLADAAELMSRILGRAPEAELVARLHAKTAGSPLFLTQLTHLIASEEWLGPKDAMSTSTMLSAESMREAVRMHIERLPTECSKVLTIASVFGVEFPTVPTAEVAGCSATSLLAALDEAFRARVVVAIPPARAGLRFAHVLVRDALYAELLPSERTRLHVAAAAALLAHYGEPVGAQVVEIARHFVEGAAAGHAVDALVWSIRAAQWQLDESRTSDASASLDAAALALEVASTSDAGRLEVAERELADVVASAGAPPRAAEVLAAMRSRMRAARASG
jgi:predicted ATPase/DNA-binding winged helix-turn-helix (wHTH) protein